MRTHSTKEEQVAFEIVRRVLPGVEIDDTTERQAPGQVDAHIVYPDGGRAALEVTMLADQRERQLEKLLADMDFRTDVAGLQYWWIVSLPPTVHLGELLRRLPHALAVAEAGGWSQLPWSAHDTDIRWLHEKGVNAHGHPDSVDPAVPGRTPGTVHLMPAGHGGAAGNVNMVPGWLTGEMKTQHVRGKVAKLVTSGLEERHLFLIVDHGGAPFAGFYALAFADHVPDVAPQVGNITHIWLAPRWSPAVLTWSRADGWQRHEPYDDQDRPSSDASVVPEHGRP